MTTDVLEMVDPNNLVEGNTYIIKSKDGEEPDKKMIYEGLSPGLRNTGRFRMFVSRNGRFAASLDTERYDFYKIIKSNAAYNTAMLGKQFELPPEIDEKIFSQITGKTRKQATSTQKQQNLSKLSKKIDEELERRKMEKEDKPTTIGNSNVNEGGRKTRKQRGKKRVTRKKNGLRI